MARILIIDDEETIRRLLSGAFERKNHTVMAVEDGIRAAEAFSKFNPDVIISDIKMPKLDGFQTIERIKSENGKLPPFIFITGHGDKTAAVEALRKGAFDYLEKPFEMDEIHYVVDRAINSSQLTSENGKLGEELRMANLRLAEQLEARTELVRRIQHPKYVTATTDSTNYGIESLGNTPAMNGVRGAIDRLSKSNLGANMSVLITGPSGAGKEIVARMLHEMSPRKDGPWVPLNCAAFPETLIEAELFGYEKGAFTGAGNRKPGVFEMADGGTLFLDEIGELPINMQAKLLRALQEQSFRRIGGTQELKVNVRVIAATNKDLKKAAENKSFREDLFYRLNSLPIVIPGLKERGATEVMRLANYFLEQTVTSTGYRARSFSAAAVEKVTAYGWPGNVRELKSVVQRAALLCDGEEIDGRAMDAALGNHSSTPLQLVSANGTEAADVALTAPAEENLGGMSYHEWKRSVVMRMEKQYLQHQLVHFSGNVSAMSRSMKVTRPNLCRLLKKHGLVAEDFRKHEREVAQLPIAA